MFERRHHSERRRAVDIADDGTRRGEQIFNRDGFLEFWAVYPLKVGRLAAIREWNRLRPDETLVAQMVKTIDWQRESRQWADGFIPHPRTWLHQGRWEDEPEEMPRGLLGRQNTRLASALQRIKREARNDS